jgi:Tfp pilus assembly protein PilF
VASLRKALDKALAHYEKKEYAEAEKGADIMVEAFPDFLRGQFLKAVILEETGRGKDAEQYYRKAGPLFPLFLRLALQLRDIDPARALIYFEKVSAMDASNNQIWLNMGIVYEKIGRTEDARKCYQKMAIQREVFSRILSPLGFFIIMIAGAIAMLKRNDMILGSLVVASAAVCFFWLKRDGGQVLDMIRKKSKHQ